MHPEPTKPDGKLSEQTSGVATNQHQNRGRNHKRLPPRLVLWTWPVEYLLQFPFKSQLHAPNKNHRVRRQSVLQQEEKQL